MYGCFFFFKFPHSPLYRQCLQNKPKRLLRIFRIWASLFLSDLDKEIYGISPKWTIHLYDFYSHPLKRFTLSLVPVGPGGFCQILRGRSPKSILGQTPRFSIVQKSSGMICDVHPEFTILQFSPSCQNTFCSDTFHACV